MAGGDCYEDWRTGLLSDRHEIPVVAIRDGRVEASTASARQLFRDLQPGMEAGDLFEESCREKLRAVLGMNASAATTELEVRQPGGTSIPGRFLLLTGDREQFLITTSAGFCYPEDLGAKLMAANSALANLTRDLSRQMHRLEAAKQAVQRLADLRELFVETLAHDLRAPLSVILLSESILRRKSLAPQSSQIDRHIDRVERSAKRMLQMIDSLLLLAQLDSADPHRISESLESLAVDQLAGEVAGDLSPLADEARVLLAVSAPERVRVRGNRAWLGQVLANLVTNAIRHAPNGTRVEIVVLAEGSDASCEVSDRGPGVPIADRERIFDRFQRGEKPGSLGLGLHICREIIRLHGGRIWVEDNPGGGARFVFRIPRSDARSFAVNQTSKPA